MSFPKDRPVRFGWRTGFVMMALLLAGCASMPNPNPRDPWEPMNRQILQFNDGVDAVLLKPVATAYRRHVPPLVRTGVSNFFGNLTDLWSSVNSLVQLNVPHALENFMRFNVNTFFGLGGILDIASEMNIERHREDLGQTLGRWGMPPGPYIVLPLLGPSTLRDALALPVDRRANPARYFDQDWRYSALALQLVDTRANLLRVTSVLEEAALDRYTFVRDAHLQRRRAEIFERRGDDPGAGSTSDGSDALEEPVKQAVTPAVAATDEGTVRQPDADPAR